MRVEHIHDATLYLADCRTVLPTLGRVDAVVTDPPYGIGIPYGRYKDTKDNLSSLIENLFAGLRDPKRICITPGQTQVSLYPPADWICAVTWDTTGSFGKCGYSQWMPILFYGEDVPGFGRNSSGIIKADLLRFSGGAGVGFQRDQLANGHPCPKPENVMRALVARFSDEGETVLDPFMGSGTTGVACANLGRRFIGVEIEERYFDIAVRRIEAAYKQPRLFNEPAPKTEQMRMFSHA